MKRLLELLGFAGMPLARLRSLDSFSRGNLGAGGLARATNYAANKIIDTSKFVEKGFTTDPQYSKIWKELTKDFVSGSTLSENDLLPEKNNGNVNQAKLATLAKFMMEGMDPGPLFVQNPLDRIAAEGHTHGFVGDLRAYPDQGAISAALGIGFSNLERAMIGTMAIGSMPLTPQQVIEARLKMSVFNRTIDGTLDQYNGLEAQPSIQTALDLWRKGTSNDGLSFVLGRGSLVNAYAGLSHDAGNGISIAAISLNADKTLHPLTGTALHLSVFDSINNLGRTAVLGSGKAPFLITDIANHPAGSGMWFVRDYLLNEFLVHYNDILTKVSDSTAISFDAVVFDYINESLKKSNPEVALIAQRLRMFDTLSPFMRDAQAMKHLVDALRTDPTQAERDTVDAFDQYKFPDNSGDPPVDANRADTINDITKKQ